MNLNRILLVVLLALLSAPAMLARAGEAVDGVTVADQQVWGLHGDQREELKANLKLPFEVEVSTNGSFTVAGGKERKIQEGQVVRRDGWLLNPDGSTEPLFDHVVMKNGRVYVVRDGQAAAITKPLVLGKSLSIAPDGSGVNFPGGQLRMQDGQLFRLDGTPIQARDTVTLKSGRVVVQKDGTLIPLLPVQMMAMSDGTRVQGNGIIQKPDGTTLQLREGQTILVDGANFSH